MNIDKELQYNTWKCINFIVDSLKKYTISIQYFQTCIQKNHYVQSESFYHLHWATKHSPPDLWYELEFVNDQTNESGHNRIQESIGDNICSIGIPSEAEATICSLDRTKENTVRTHADIIACDPTRAMSHRSNVSYSAFFTQISLLFRMYKFLVIMIVLISNKRFFSINSW